MDVYKNTSFLSIYSFRFFLQYLLIYCFRLLVALLSMNFVGFILYDTRNLGFLDRDSRYVVFLLGLGPVFGAG